MNTLSSSKIKNRRTNTRLNFTTAKEPIVLCFKQLQFSKHYFIIIIKKMWWSLLASFKFSFRTKRSIKDMGKNLPLKQYGSPNGCIHKFVRHVGANMFLAISFQWTGPHTTKITLQGSLKTIIFPVFINQQNHTLPNLARSCKQDKKRTNCSFRLGFNERDHTQE